MTARTIVQSGIVALGIILLAQLCLASPKEATIQLISSPAPPCPIYTAMEVVRQGDTCTLMVHRVKRRLRLSQPKPDPIPITLQEFEQIWAVVEKHDLKSLAVEIRDDGPRVADFGMRKIVLTWGNAFGTTRHEASWSQPIPNAGGVNALYAAIDALNTRKAEEAAGATCPCKAHILWRVQGGEPVGSGVAYELDRNGDRCVLRVKRRSGGPEPTVRTTTYKISLREFAALWQLVKDHQLDTFKAVEQGEEKGVVMDFGVEQILVEWEDITGKSCRNSQSWSQPLADDKDVNAFIEALRLMESRHRTLENGPVLAQVEKGQVYTFRRTIPGEADQTYTWTILEVHPAGVYYELNDPARGKPQRVLWRFEPDSEETRRELKPGAKFMAKGLWLPYDTVVFEIGIGDHKHVLTYSRLLGRPSFPACLRWERNDMVEELVSLTHPRH